MGVLAAPRLIRLPAPVPGRAAEDGWGAWSQCPCQNLTQSAWAPGFSPNRIRVLAQWHPSCGTAVPTHFHRCPLFLLGTWELGGETPAQRAPQWPPARAQFPFLGKMAGSYTLRVGGRWAASTSLMWLALRISSSNFWNFRRFLSTRVTCRDRTKGQVHKREDKTWATGLAACPSS